MKTPLGTEVGLYLGPGRIVLDGDRAPQQKGHSSPPLFRPCLLWPRSPVSATAELLYNKISTKEHSWKVNKDAYAKPIESYRYYDPEWPWRHCSYLKLLNPCLIPCRLVRMRLYRLTGNCTLAFISDITELKDCSRSHTVEYSIRGNGSCAK